MTELLHHVTLRGEVSALAINYRPFVPYLCFYGLNCTKLKLCLEIYCNLNLFSFVVFCGGDDGVSAETQTITGSSRG